MKQVNIYSVDFNNGMDRVYIAATSFKTLLDIIRSDYREDVIENINLFLEDVYTK